MEPLLEPTESYQETEPPARSIGAVIGLYFMVALGYVALMMGCVRL